MMTREEYLAKAEASLKSWQDEKKNNLHGMADKADRAIAILEDQIKTVCRPDWCPCGNQMVGFDCVCYWVDKNPGTTNYACEYCGIYTAGKPHCNKCEGC